VTATSTEAHPARRADIEAWLTERSVDWVFEPDLPIAKIDVAKSLSNQARLTPLDQDVVDRYAADIDRGHVFPPVIALDQGGKSRIRLLGGNHRLAAHIQLKRKTIPAYVVQSEPEMAMRLTYEDNRRHGLPPSETERIVAAIHLCETGYSQEAAAAMVGVSSARISQERTMLKATRRAKDLGVDMDGFNALPRWSRYALGQLRSDPVFTEATSLVLRARLNLDEVKELVNALKEAKSDNDAMQILGLEEEAYQSRIQRTSGGKIRRTVTPRASTLRAMKEIRNRLADAVVASTPTSEAKAQLRKEVEQTIAHLETLRKALR